MQSKNQVSMKLPRYKLVTALLVIYALFMTLYFGTDLLKSGHATRFWLTVAGETLCIVLTFFALRRRDRLRQQRQSEISDKVESQD